MRILIVNDDGIHAEGIRTLAAHLSRSHDVAVVAPESEKSATAHAITIYRPLRVKSVDLSGLESVPCFAVDGLPVDCTKIGLSHLMHDGVDMVVSGINHGPNLGSDVVYSGTVAAALDAVIMGYPALAVSIGAHRPKHLETAAIIAVSLIDKGVVGKPDDVLYNLNVPDLPIASIKGIRAARQGHTFYDHAVEVRDDPRGNKYIWMAGTLRDIDTDADTDVALLRDGYATLTPVKYDLTAKDKMHELSCKIENLKLHY